MMSSIVVLTDSVAHPNRGLAYAAGLAGPMEAELVLLHVRYDELLSNQEYVTNHSSRRAEEERNQALKALAESQSVPAEVEISEDFLSDAVAASTRQHQSQLVVLNRPAASAMPAEVVTRVVEDMLRQVPLPLLVPPGAALRFAARGSCSCPRIARDTSWMLVSPFSTRSSACSCRP